jgi:hypothetical protein
MRQRLHFSVLLAVALLSCGACNKEAPPQPAVVAPSDRVSPSPVGTSQMVLEKTFSVKSSTTFPFEIPAHAVQPHLHGIFESFAGQLHGASDDSANVDFLIMNEEQQAALASGHPSEAIFDVEASHNQAINFDLPASMSRPVKYYLVFRNSSDKGSKVVEANFRVDF